MSIAVPLYGFGASGGEGGTLKVNAPPLVAVTITNKAGKTKTKTANADGMAIFKGLASGEWNVTIVNSDGKPTTITADVQTEYTVTIAFFSATINITYPAGSTCTCSDGTTTLSAPDTSGTWACIVPNAGTWTVAATDGVENTSESVSITTDGQIVAIELSYLLWLYKSGNTYNAVTGGWTYTSKGYSSDANTAGTPTITRGDTMLTAQMPNASGAIIHPANKIDLTEYSTIVFDGIITGATRYASLCNLRVWSEFGKYSSVGYSASVTIQENVDGEVSLDVSELSGKFYIGFALWTAFPKIEMRSMKLQK